MLLYILLVALLAYTYHNSGTPTRVLWAFCMTGIWYTLLMGQVNVLMLLLTVGAWQSISAGLLIGILAAIKPNFLLWPGFLLLRGYWIPAFPALFAFGLHSILPIFSFGSLVNTQWIEMLLLFKAASLATNMSLYELTSRFGLPELDLVLAVILFGITGFMAWRNKLPPQQSRQHGSCQGFSGAEFRLDGRGNGLER